MNYYNAAFFSKVLLVFTVMCSHHAMAYDPLDPNGNITLKWDVVQWTGDGYVVSG